MHNRRAKHPDNDLTFKPSINESSRQLAEKRVSSLWGGKQFVSRMDDDHKQRLARQSTTKTAGESEKGEENDSKQKDTLAFRSLLADDLEAQVMIDTGDFQSRLEMDLRKRRMAQQRAIVQLNREEFPFHPDLGW